MILVIDNYDSFAHNLARYFACEGAEYRVIRNNASSIDEIAALAPQSLILSPGPCTPKEAGICVELIQELGPTIPILGVCLGHQCIGEAYGGQTLRAAAPMHGKASAIRHNGEGLFSRLPNPLMGGRYHSLIASIDETTPLEITARSENGEIMAFQHKTHPVYGVQFHPESVLTEHGPALIRNFLALATNWNAEKREAA